MKNILRTTLLLTYVCIYAACTPLFAAGSADAFKTITPSQAKAVIDTNPAAVIVDVRTIEEFQSGHIPRAVLLTNESISEKSAAAVLPDKKAIILIYCRSGNRSRQAAVKLTALGYTNVSDFGGIINWPFEIVR